MHRFMHRFRRGRHRFMLHYSFCKGQDNRTNIPKRDVDRFRSHLRAINTDTPQHKDSLAKERSGNEARRRGVDGDRGDDGRGQGRRRRGRPTGGGGGGGGDGGGGWAEERRHQRRTYSARPHYLHLVSRRRHVRAAAHSRDIRCSRDTRMGSFRDRVGSCRAELEFGLSYTKD